MPGLLQTHADRRPFLLGRMRIMAALRDYFTTRDFVEVETSILTRSPGNETHLHAFATDLISPAGTRERYYLRTSPEFASKKLLAAGERRIVEFARVLRNRESGALHHPEFTLVEWYRANESWEAVAHDCCSIIALAAEIAGTTRFSFRGRTINPLAEPQRLSVVEAFRCHAGIDLLAVLPPERIERFAAAARVAGVRVLPTDSWGDVFSRVLLERIEPHLGNGQATILYDYPAVQSPLAQPKPSSPGLAERFELYACGIELANGFGELTDPVLQRARLEEQMVEKERIYGEQYPIDEEFIGALELMPPASGVALGLDRLVMLATGATRIDQVLWTPMIE
ncbi:MAG TPA: EF-P lysine aminoacylase EpmA [Xanthobacteraceae bacterium]